MAKANQVQGNLATTKDQAGLENDLATAKVKPAWGNLKAKPAQGRATKASLNDPTTLMLHCRHMTVRPPQNQGPTPSAGVERGAQNRGK